MKFTLRKNEVTVFVESLNEFVSFPRGNSEFDQVYQYLMRPDATDRGFMSMFLAAADNIIQRYTEGAIEVGSDGATLDGVKIPESILDKINELRRSGYSWQQHQKFWFRCLLNPRPESIVDLFRFIEHHDLVITEDGKFLGYKAITHNFRDKYTNSIDNTIGTIVTMPREQVEYNPDRACSTGLHVACYNYAKNYMCPGDRLVIVEVDPANVVSVPRDSNSEKIRVCEYKVVREVDPEASPMKTSVVEVKDTVIATQDGDDFVSVKPGSHWGEVEHRLFLTACGAALEKNKDGSIDWEEVAELFPGRSVSALTKRWKMCANLVKELVKDWPKSAQPDWKPTPQKKAARKTGACKKAAPKKQGGVKKTRSVAGTKWTPAEERKLYRAYEQVVIPGYVTQKHFCEEYAKKLGRTAGAVRHKIEEYDQTRLW